MTRPRRHPGVDAHPGATGGSSASASARKTRECAWLGCSASSADNPPPGEVMVDLGALERLQRLLGALGALRSDWQLNPRSPPARPNRLPRAHSALQADLPTPARSQVTRRQVDHEPNASTTV